jgi:phage shock protein A
MTEPLPIHLHIHVEPPEPDPLIAEIHSMVTALTEGAKAMASELDDLTAKVTENADVTQSAITLLNGLKEQLDAAGTDPAALAALSQALGSSSSALADAVAANTPAAPNAPEQQPA